MQPNSILSVQADASADPYATARLLMVDGQIRPNRVNNPILLDAFEAVPRELFVAPAYKAMAYLEGECPVSATRMMLAPMIFARMVEALQLTRADSVLVVGGGTGYGTAIIAALTQRVTMLEPDAALAELADNNLQRLNLPNVTVKIAPLDRVTTETYTAIFVEGAISQISDALAAQLGEGGRMVAIVGGSDTLPGIVTLATKLHGSLSRSVLFEASARYLPGMTARQGFTF